jgi:hypothetical protein
MHAQASEIYIYLRFFCYSNTSLLVAKQCAAAIIELRFDTTETGPKYCAAVEFISRAAWNEELEKLLLDRDESVMQQCDGLCHLLRLVQQFYAI